MSRPFIALCALCLVACSVRPVTEIVVVSDSDLQVPGQLDAIEIEITPPSGLSVQRVAMLSGPDAGADTSALPVTLGIVHRGGPLEPVTITVRGRHGADVIVVRRGVLAFVEGHTLVVALPLQGACVAVSCADGQTCAAGACRDVAIQPTELADFDGSVPRLDDAGPGCFAVREICNGTDDDCDTMIDEGIDLATDPNDCGACGHVCPNRPNAGPACQAGLCTIVCQEGFGDCNGLANDGCEAQLNTLTMCNVCGMGCAVPHGAPTCFLGTCAVSSCAPGWGDCNTTAGDGCEAPLNAPTHCGGCAACALVGATASCVEGVCGIAACSAGLGDCNAMASDGCETHIDTLAACGACGRSCPTVDFGLGGCVLGACTVASCVVGHADCDRSAADGCETSTTTLSDCGACGAACALAHATETCGAAGCALGTCDVGWGDCNVTSSDGCETPLDTSADCGRCGHSCVGGSLFCGTVGASRDCVSACPGTELLCSGTCADLTSSLTHCGACGAACAPAHAAAACTASTCGILSCDPGFGDCNASVIDGCETPLDSLTNCGACGAACDLAGGTEMCAAGRCVVTLCDAGLADCDAIPSNGCETSLQSLTDCGGCGVRCALAGASESCASGTCQIGACDVGHANCNGIAADGCEIALATLTDCRACADVCDVPRATESCATGTCALGTCDAAWGDCNATVSDGCERSLTTAADCGACGVRCVAAANTTASCATGTCAFTCLTGYADCNGSPLDGCEVRLDSLSNCGTCGHVCSAVSRANIGCVVGVCAITSCTSSSRANCNGLYADGCEVDLRFSNANCGMCGRACTMGTSCSSSTCQ